MKDTTKLNITNDSGDDKPDDPLTSHTPQQRRTINKGLRILARVAIRSYLRGQGGELQAETGTDAKEG